ncbi:MAG: metallophosphoesterase family protein [Bacteroidales bacterium]|nr:metallophosphoesterase family protein [Bacteroidales bacterium]
MTRIGLISDTHGYWDDKFLTYFEECDEIWHAGDICSSETMERLQAPFGNPARRCIVRAVCGNCDGGDLRRMFPEVLRFKCEDVDVLMKHIGGYPGKYDRSIQRQIYANPPQLFISGHSHILKIQRDPLLGLLHINPGAAGQQGWHMERTLVRMTIDGAMMKDVEVITLADRQIDTENL